MKTPHSGKTDIGLPELASRILDRYLDGTFPESAEEKILDWMIDPQQRMEKDHALEAVWLKHVEYKAEPGKEAYKMYGELAKRLNFQPEEEKFIDRNLWRRASMRIAAVLIPLMLLAGITWVTYTGENGTDDLAMRRQAKEEVFLAVMDEAETTVSVPQGGRGNALLADGTYVLLDEGTTISYDDKGEVLLSGEGYFRAPKTRDEPLAVKTVNMTVTVTGTTFEVDARKGHNVNTIRLYTGSVTVNAAGNEYMLSPQTQLSYNSATEEVSVVPLGSSLPDWVASKLKFDSDPLGTIFSDLEWYYNVEFKVGKGVDMNQRWTFTMNGSEKLEDILGMMKKAGAEFNYSLGDGKAYIQ